MTPMTTIIKDYVGKEVSLYVGTAWIFGTVVKVADDGQAVRLEQKIYESTKVTFIDLAFVKAISLLP